MPSSRGSGRIEDACGESPAASPFGYVLWVKCWVVLGGVRGAFLLIFYWCSYHFVKIDVFDVKTIRKRFWDDFFSKMTPSCPPRREQNLPKINQNRLQKMIKKMIDFWLHFGPQRDPKIDQKSIIF